MNSSKPVGNMLLFALCIGAALNVNLACGQESAGAKPAATVCVLELDLPEGTELVVDGREHGAKRTLNFGNLVPGKEYRSKVQLRLARGAIAERQVAVRGGTSLKLALADFLDASSPGAMWRNPLAATRSESAAISPDGKLIATIGSDELTAEVFDVQTGGRVHSFSEHSKRIRSLAFSADGRMLATCGEDNLVLTWNLANGKRVLKVSPPEHPKWAATAVSTYRFRPLAGLGEAIGAGVGDGLDQSLVEPFRRRLSHVNCVVFSPDAKLILSAQFDGSVRLWNAAIGQQLRQFCGPTSAYSNETLPEIKSAAFSADGTRVIAADSSGWVRAWDTSSGQRVLNIRADETSARSAQFSPDGKLVLTLGADRVARLWDAATGKHLHLMYPGDPAVIQEACFATDGQVLTLCADSTIRTWDSGTGKEASSITLAPAFFAKSGLVVNLADDTVLTKGLLGYQLRELKTGHVTRQFHSSGKQN